MSYQGADDDTVWFGSIDHAVEKEGVLSEEQVQAVGAEDVGIGVAPVPNVLEVLDIFDEEEQVDDLDPENDWNDFALIPDVNEFADQEQVLDLAAVDDVIDYALIPDVNEVADQEQVLDLAAVDDVIDYAPIPDVPEVADQEQIHVPAAEDDVIYHTAALVALRDEDAAYLEHNFAALNFDQGKDLQVPYYDIHPLKKAAKLGVKGMLKKKGNLAPRRAEKLAAKIQRGGSYGTSEGTAIITYGSYGENGLEF